MSRGNAFARRRCLVFSAVIALTASGATCDPASAELAARYRNWGTGPAHHLFTAADRAAWAEIADDQAAEQFIRLFWARRDPTPETADNETQREFERRVALADQLFAETHEQTAVRGALTERGRALVLLGPPHRRQKAGSSGEQDGGNLGLGSSGETPPSIPSGSGPGNFGTGGGQDRFGVASEERWTYEAPEKPVWINKRKVQVTFRSIPSTGVVGLHRGEEALALMAEAVERSLVRPTLTAADLGTNDLGLAPRRVWAARDDADAASLTAVRAALTAAAPPGFTAALDAAAFQATDGTWIIPLQVATTSPPPAGSKLVGELTLLDAPADAKPLRFTIDDGAWQAGKGQHEARATLIPSPGDYELAIGLVDNTGAALWTAVDAVTIPADESGAFWVSELLVAEEIGALPKAQAAFEPFAWQGIAIHPKGDRSFVPGTTLWYYLHACNPSLDATGRPQLTTVVEMGGAARFKGAVRIEPAKAGDHCYVLAQAFDIEAKTFPAGSYRLTVKVTDTASGKTLPAFTTFNVPAGS